MKIYSDLNNYDEQITLAKNLKDTTIHSYNSSVIFHCYWNGVLNEKCLYSIKSCYYFNVWNRNHRIILWIENNSKNEYNDLIKKYCKIKIFSLRKEKRKSSKYSNYELNCNYDPNKGKDNSYFEIRNRSNFIRMLLLYNYGGCWFDTDCYFLQSFDPLFSNFENDVCLYQWEKQLYPNNAIIISIKPKSKKLESCIDWIIENKEYWGFQVSNITYDLPLDMLILPCEWFDGSWVPNPYNLNFKDFFTNTDSEYTFDNFFPNSFCYHWHNMWNEPIEENSIIMQLNKIIDYNLKK